MCQLFGTEKSKTKAKPAGENSIKLASMNRPQNFGTSTNVWHIFSDGSTGRALGDRTFPYYEKNLIKRNIKSKALVSLTVPTWPNYRNTSLHVASLTLHD